MEEDVDEFLAHFGVKGMRWGNRKGSSRPSSNDIHNARLRTAARLGQQQSHVHAYNTATTEAGRRRATEAIDKIGKEGAADLKLANMKTRGEKIGTALVVGALGVTALGLVAPKK